MNHGQHAKTHEDPGDRCAVDAHTHIFCWGERPHEGYLSESTRRKWISRLAVWLTGLKRERGDDLSAKLRNMLLRHLESSRLDYAVVLAQDAVYRADGSVDHSATHFYVSNDYVLELARQCPKVLPGVSINPLQSDARAELDRCIAAGARLVKIHTAIQGVDPALKRFDELYRHAAEAGVVLTFHTGYEHSCCVVSQSFADPARLARPLDHGGVIVAAHCGTCAFFDREDFYPSFVKMMHRYPNLYGDTAVLASWVRPAALRTLSREPQSLKDRIIHGSDYPLPPARLPYALRTGLFPKERHNPLDMDLRIKQSYGFGQEYATGVLGLLGLSG